MDFLTASLALVWWCVSGALKPLSVQRTPRRDDAFDAARNADEEGTLLLLLLAAAAAAGVVARASAAKQTPNTTTAER